MIGLAREVANYYFHPAVRFSIAKVLAVSHTGARPLLVETVAAKFTMA